jgi:hypothetical protein
MGKNEMKSITYDMLRQAGACEEQREMFRRLFPHGVIPTAELILAHPEFDYDWLVDHLLTGKALAEYERAIAPALAEYERAIALAWAAYQRAIIPAKANKRAIALAFADYESAITPAGAAYQHAEAAAFLTGWEMQ